MARFSDPVGQISFTRAPQRELFVSLLLIWAYRGSIHPISIVTVPAVPAGAPHEMSAPNDSRTGTGTSIRSTRTGELSLCRLECQSELLGRGKARWKGRLEKRLGVSRLRPGRASQPPTSQRRFGRMVVRLG